jgi:hypothetical protein
MLDLKIDVSGLRAAVTRLQRAPAAVQAGMTAGLRRGVIRVHGDAVQRLRGGNPLRTRTGNLARALFWRVEQSAEAIVGRVGYDRAKAIYGRIQELGGVITPKRAKHLTIPVGAALTGSGVPRFTARDLLANPKAFGFRSAFVTPRHTAIVGVRADRSLEALFALKDRVELPARPVLGPALHDNEDQLRADIRAGVLQALRAAGLGSEP